jgi:hypothetical protein
VVKFVRPALVYPRRGGAHAGLAQGERFEDTKKRLQTRMGATDKELSKMKFSIIQSSFAKPTYINDGASATPAICRARLTSS